MDMREMKGLEIARISNITETWKGWHVPSQSGKGYYHVSKEGMNMVCTCPDCEIRKIKCKHQWAVEFYLKRTIDEQGKETITKAVRITYPQNWKAYNQSQTKEIELFDMLLRDLTNSIDEPEQTIGRPRLSLQEQTFCSIQKVYSQLSSRRAYTLYKNAEGREQIGKAPNFNAINKFLNRAEITPILENLLNLSAMPLKSVETTFAPDSSGFRTTQFSEYLAHRYHRPRLHHWIKAHLLVGVKTNVVVNAKITEELDHDSTQFRPLIEGAYDSGFQIKEIVADKAYSSRDSYDYVDSIGGMAYIPFKSNATGRAKTAPLWNKMFHYFQFNKEEFLEHYHKRSNVETAFFMIKTKFGDKLKSKKWIAQKNELLCKLIAHNICVLISEMHELGIKPEFSGS